MYFNTVYIPVYMCASQQNQLHCVCNYFSFSRTRRRATKSLKFPPCGVLAKKKKHKIYVFQCATKQITVRIHRMEKVSKKEISWTPPLKHMWFFAWAPKKTLHHCGGEAKSWGGTKILGGNAKFFFTVSSLFCY